MTRHAINYDEGRKRFWVKINNGQRYEKSSLEELTRELARLGVKWKLSRAAKKQVPAFNPKR